MKMLLPKARFAPIRRLVRKGAKHFQELGKVHCILFCSPVGPDRMGERHLQAAIDLAGASACANDCN